MTTTDRSDSSRSATLRLRQLPLAGRLGLTALMLVFCIGSIASLAFIYDHNHMKDGEPGLSMLDLRGTYHGVNVPSPLRTALERGHPAPHAPPLDEATSSALRAWLARDDNAISRDYDNLDLGDMAPSELIAANCLQCHGRTESATLGGDVALYSWETVKRVAFGREINPPPISILIISTHAHAPTLGVIAIVLILLLAFSRWRRGLTGALAFLMGVGLLADIGGWWAARSIEAFVYAIVIGGAAFNLAMVATLLLILAELWLPERRSGTDTVSG